MTTPAKRTPTFERKIDYDRGVLIKQIASTGMEVFMYRNDPGVYYTAHGSEVNKALAELAGFDVTRHTAMREHRQRVNRASEMIAKELEVDNGVGKRIVVQEVAGFKMVDLGKGRYWVEDEHGPLNKGTVLTKDMAETVFNACVGDLRKQAVPADTNGRGRTGGGTVAPAKSD